MSTDRKAENEIETLPSSSKLIQRSGVDKDLPYTEYKKPLRHDFFYSCAYCGMSETEAHGISYAIDHYEPRKSRPDLVNSYDNLMYCCDECNSRKGDRCPPPEARRLGMRFYRPDQDLSEDHFKPAGIRVDPISSTGEYTIDALDLNRMGLRELRKLRAELAYCAAQIASGITVLRNFRYDQLPTNIKAQAIIAAKKAGEAEIKLADQIDQLLRDFARSNLIDPPMDAEEVARLKARNERLEARQSLIPGEWRAPRTKKKG